MERVIIADSSCELNEELRKKIDAKIIPFSVEVDEKTYIDKIDLNQKEFVEVMARSKGAPTTAAPSPNLFMDAFEAGKENFVITISSKLSATYNNALLAKDMFLEDNDAKIHIFNSKSASAGETLIAVKLKQCIDKGLEFDEIVEEVESFIKIMRTYFILDNFDNLIKNGRMSKFKGAIASVLSFRPIMGSDDGSIKLFEKARGFNKALVKLTDMVKKDKEKYNDSTFIIAHCDAEKRAKDLKSLIEEKYDFKDIQIVKTGLLSSVYANGGGIVVAF